MKSTNSYTPITKLSEKRKEYYIHNNGDRPYKVAINEKNIDIYVYAEADPEKYKKR